MLDGVKTIPSILPSPPKLPPTVPDAEEDAAKRYHDKHDEIGSNEFWQQVFYHRLRFA
jgi:hypothetical protein